MGKLLPCYGYFASFLRVILERVEKTPHSLLIYHFFTRCENETSIVAAMPRIRAHSFQKAHILCYILSLYA